MFLKAVLYLFGMMKVLKIGVISDTHLLECTSELERLAGQYFTDTDMVLHAGDLVSSKVLKAFKGKDVRAVRGNMDTEKTLPERLIIEAEGVKIGLIHGWGMPFGIEEKLRGKFDRIDCLVYGHTHNPANRVRDGVLYFNPGSATDDRFGLLNTVGILEIKDGSIEGRILELRKG